MEVSAGPLVNKTELARNILRCALPTVDALIAKYPDFPVERRGSNGVEWQFNAEKVVAFLEAKRDEERRAVEAREDFFAQFSLPIDEVAPEEAKGLSPQQRAQLAQARLREQQLAKEAGFLVQTSDVRMVLHASLGRFGKFLDTIPAQLAKDFNLPDEVARAMRARLNEARRVFVRDLRAWLAAEEPELRDGTRG